MLEATRALFQKLAAPGVTPGSEPLLCVVKRSFVSGDSGKFLPSSQLGDLPLLIGSIFDCQQMEGQVSKNTESFKLRIPQLLNSVSSKEEQPHTTDFIP